MLFIMPGKYLLLINCYMIIILLPNICFYKLAIRIIALLCIDQFAIKHILLQRRSVCVNG